MPKRAFVPPISAGLVNKTPKAQRQHIAKRYKDHFKDDLPLHIFVPRKKPRAPSISAAANNDIEVLVTEIDALDDKLKLMVQAVGIKTDDVIIVNQAIHVPDGTSRQEFNPEDGLTYTIPNLAEDPEEALLETIRLVVGRWESQT